MDPRLLSYYNRELQHVREVGAEFAREFPKIAGRLGLEGFECADPYVERLLEGFAFLTARVQLKLDAEFPVFTQHLLEILYPHYLAPTPSTAVVQLKPDPKEGGLAAGHPVPRGTVLKSLLGKSDKTACEYRTAHEVKLYPLELTEAKYYDSPATLAAAGISPGRAKAGMRLSLRTTANVPLAQLQCDALPLFIAGADALPRHIYEQLLANGTGLVLRAREQPAQVETLPRSAIRRRGFDDGEALIPYGGRSFSGYRLLQEYFACPERFLFVELAGLRPFLQRAAGNEFDIFVLLDKACAPLQGGLDAQNFRLFCTPAINLFPRRTDRIHLEPGRTEYHLVVDRTRPLDFEVHSLGAVEGFGVGSEPEQRFLPFYACDELSWHAGHAAFYTLRREPRLLSARARGQGPRSSYVGSEVFLSLVDARQAPYAHGLRQLGIEALCTNRDLPLHMPVGKANTDFTLESGAPVESIRCVAGPKRPQAAAAFGESAWRLVSALSLNYLSVLEHGEDGARALRELLGLYGDGHDPAIARQIEGVRGIKARGVVRRLPLAGPISFGRGQEITLTCDDLAFEGTGAFLLGAVLAEFFARLVSINSFTETVLRSTERGEIHRWTARPGLRPSL